MGCGVERKLIEPYVATLPLQAGPDPFVKGTGLSGRWVQLTRQDCRRDVSKAGRGVMSGLRRGQFPKRNKGKVVGHAKRRTCHALVPPQVLV
jgi:hypothetical protein